MPLVMRSAERRSSDRALASAPASSRSRIFSASGAAHISAVAPALLAALGSAPASSSRFTSAASPYQCRRHQRRRAAGASRHRHARLAAQLRVDAGAIAVADRAHQTHRVGVDRRRRRLAGGGVRPDRALVDPLPDDLGLFARQRAGRRHLLAERGADHAVIQAAAVGVAGSDVGLAASAQGVGAPIEPESAELLRRAVAADAVLAEDRLHIALEIDRGRSRPCRGKAGVESEDRCDHPPILIP